MINYGFKYKWITWFREYNDHWKRKKIKFQYKKARKRSVQTLKKIDIFSIPNNLKEIRLFAIMRNESLRLPHFLAYYKQLGVDRFFFIDNNSYDNSAKIILEQENTHLFHTSETYVNHWYWIEYLLETYGQNHWCIVVDIDELFYYPNIDLVSVPRLIDFLEKNKFTAIRTFLLDMYSKTNIADTKYDIGNSPLDVISYFDTKYEQIYFSFPDRKQTKYFSDIIFIGGMRERVFGKTSPPHILSKIPLFKYESATYLAQGMHAINGAKLADIQGVVFHTKFLSDFIDEVKKEVIRGQHYGNAVYYKNYETQINNNPAINFYNNASEKFKDANQLVSLGIMQTSEQFEQFCQDITE